MARRRKRPRLSKGKKESPKAVEIIDISISSDEDSVAETVIHSFEELNDPTPTGEFKAAIAGLEADLDASHSKIKDLEKRNHELSRKVSSLEKKLHLEEGEAETQKGSSSEFALEIEHEKKRRKISPSPSKSPRVSLTPLKKSRPLSISRGEKRKKKKKKSPKGSQSKSSLLPSSPKLLAIKQKKARILREKKILEDKILAIQRKHRVGT